MLYSLSENVLSVMVNLSNSGIFSATKKNRKWPETHFQYKCDTSHLKAELKFLDFFYSSYRKPGSFFLRKPTDSLMFVHDGVWCECECVRVRVSAEWQVSELSAVLTHSPPAVFNQYSSEFQPSHTSAHANTHARTDAALQYLSARRRGNTKYEQLHTYAAKCIRSALTYLRPPPHTHTHEWANVCLYVRFSVDVRYVRVSITGRR